MLKPATLLLCAALLQVQSARADTVAIRLVAKQGDKMVLLSDLRTYRMAPGGLVAVEWTGGVQIGEVPVFTQVPLVMEEGAKEKDEFLEELAKTDPSAIQKQKRYVDPLYEGKGVGPEFIRPSTREVNLNGQEFLLTPGDIGFRTVGGTIRSDDPRLRVTGDGALEIECVPLLLTSAVAGGSPAHVPFQPTLTYKGRNLLADVLYQPDEFHLVRKTAGAAATFLRLELYLVPNVVNGAKKVEYRLEDTPFHIGKNGVELAAGTDVLKKLGSHHLSLQQRPPQSIPPARQMPIMKLGPVGYHNLLVKFNPGDEWFYGSVPLPDSSGSPPELHFVGCLGFRHAKSETRFSMLSDFDRFPLRVCLMEARRGARFLPAAYVFSHSPRLTGDKLQVRITGVRGSEDLLNRRRQIPARLRKGHFTGEVAWGGHPLLLQATAERGVYEADLPEGTRGLVTLAFPEFVDPKAWIELPYVVGAPDAKGSLTFLTPRNRVRYTVGEAIEIHAVGRAKQSLQMQVHVTLREGPRSLKLHSFGLRIGASAATHTFRLDTHRLKPGCYVVGADADDLLVYRVGFQLFPKEPPTDYPSVAMKSFSHETPDRRIGYLRHLMGASPRGTLYNLMPEERAAIERAGRLPDYWAAALRSDPLLPAPERTATLSTVQHALSVAAAHGSRFYWEPAAGYVQYNIKHTTDIDNARMYRYQQMYVQQARGFASFGGVANYWHAPVYGYWEGSPPVDGHQPIRNRKVGTDFKEATGLSKPTRDEIRQVTTGKGDPRELEELRERLLRWRYWEASVLPKAFKLWHEAMDEIQPGLWLLNRPPSGWATGPSSYPIAFFGPLDVVSTYNITDFGRMPFDLPYGTAISTAGIHDRLKFIHAWTWSRGGALSEALLAMTGGADGVDPSANELVSQNIFGRFATFDRRQVMEVFSRYGNFIRRLGFFKDIAILFSTRQAWGEADRSHEDRVRSLFHDLLRSRRSAKILLDEDLPKGKLEGYRALFLLGLTAKRPEAEMAAIRQFEKAGGIVFKDEHCADSYPGRAVTLWDKAKPGYPRGDGEFEFVQVWKDYLLRQEALNGALAQVPAPFAKTDSPRCLLGFRAGRRIRFLAVINDEVIPLELEGRYRQLYTLPAKSTVTFDREYVAYDLLAGGESRKVRTVDLDFASCEARLFALADQPLGAMEIHIPTSVAAGDVLPIAVQVKDTQGRTIPDPLPFEIVIRAPDGAQRTRLHRTLAPGESLDFPTGINDIPGTWRVECRDLISGMVASAECRLAAPTKGSPVSHVEPDVMVFDRPAIHRFFARERRLRLLLCAGQERLVPVAEGLAAACSRLGRAAEVKVIQRDEVHDVPLRWQHTQRDREIWAAMEAGEAIGYRHGLRTTVDPKQQVDYARPSSGYRDPGPRHLISDDLILIGQPGQNRFLDDATQLAPRKVSDQYPGPGRALVQHVWSPFWARRHVVTVSGSDDAGLKAGCKTLIALLSGTPEADPEPRVAEATPMTTPTGSRQRTKLPRFLGSRFGSPILSLSVSPDGNFLAVAARLYGPNLFLLDREGKILWKEHLGLRGPEEITVTRDGDRVYAQDGQQVSIFDRTGKTLCRKPIPRPSVSAKMWTAGPTPLLIHPQSQDFLLGGRQSVRRVGPDGETKWEYSDVPWCSEALDFYHQRAAFLKALSPDGKFLVASMFGVARGQLGYLSSYWKPGLVMFDTDTGKVLWRHNGLVVNNSMAVTTGERTVVYDDDGSISVFDGGGQVVNSFEYPPGLEDMRLSADGNTLVLRTAMARGHIQQAYGRSMHLVRLDLTTTEASRFPTEGEIRDFDISPDGQLVAASSWDSRLYLFRLGGKKLWERPTNGGCLVRFHPSGQRIITGSATGQIRWLDLAGNELRRLDLLPFNHPAKDFVRTVLDDNDLPELKVKPMAGEQASVFDRARNCADFNFLPAGKLKAKTRVLDQPIDVPVAACPANSTFIISFFVRAEREWKPAPYDRVKVEALEGSRTIYSASMPIAKDWRERLVSFKTGRRPAKIRLRISPERYKPLIVGLVASQGAHTRKVEPVVPFVIDRFRWARVSYRSRNWLRSATADDLLAGGTVGGGVGGDVKGRILIPNPYPATYRMPTIQPRIGEITFIDGKITDQETSWARGNSIEAKGITDVANKPFWYAHLYLTLPKPRNIAAIAVYEDNRGPVQMKKAWQGTLLREKTATRFAVLARDAVTKKWRPFGNVTGNLNVFNLFVGEPMKADMVHYFWAGSSDWHIRLAEIEAYSAASETDDELGTVEEGVEAGGGDADFGELDQLDF